MLVPALALRFSRFPAFLLALVSLCGVAWAQDPTPTPNPVQMSLASPLAITEKPISLMARRGKWFPIAVTLSNTGDPVTGTLRLKLVSSSGFENAPNDIYCPVDLPTNANKVVWLYGRLDRSNVTAVDVSYSGRGFKAPYERVPVQEPDEGQRLVVTISDNDTGLVGTLRNLRGPRLALNGSMRPTGFAPSASQAPLRAFETGRANVPDRWFGLDATDMVVLSDFPHNALLPPQIEALRGYVIGGGTLLVMGGNNAARLRSSPLADLWPGQISNSSPGSAAEVASIVRRYVASPQNGADRLGGAPPLVTRIALQRDALLHAGSQARPLYSSIERGAGRVLFLGYDPSQPPFSGWSGQPELWADIFASTLAVRELDGVDRDYVTLGSQPGFNGNYNGNFNPYNYNNGQTATPTGSLLAQLSKAPQLAMPPVSQIAWFLSLYVFVLVPLNYTVLRLIDRRELAWITIPVIVAIFSAFAYTAALSLRGTAILTRQVDVVQTSLGSKTARTDSLLWLFSPKRTTYDISSENRNAAVVDYANDAGGKQGAFSILQPADTSAFKVEGANVWMWTDRAFVSQSLTDLKDGITLSGNQVKNGTPFELNGAVWVQDHQVRSLGTIQSGGSASIPQNATQQVTSSELSGAILSTSGIDQIFDSSTVSNGIPNRALSAALGEGYGRQNEGALLVAWAKQPFSPLQIGVNGARTKDVTLLILRVPSPVNGPIALREAIVTQANDSGSSLNPMMTLMGSTYYNCLLPPASSWKLSIRGTGGSPFIPPKIVPPGAAASGGKVRLNGLDFAAWNSNTRRWVPLRGAATRDDSPIGGWNFTAPIGADLPRQPDRLLRLRVNRRNGNVVISNVRVVAN